MEVNPFYLLPAMILCFLILAIIYVFLVTPRQTYVEVSLFIDYGDGRVSRIDANVTNGTPLLQLLNATHYIEYKDGGILGKYVTNIDGVVENDTFWWMYYVDDKLFMIGQSNFFITQSCNITFKLVGDKT